MTIYKPVVIIGAGLAGLALALQLSQHGVPVEIRELRQPKDDHAVGGAVMLGPNGLRVLDKIGIYKHIKDKGYSFTHVEYRDEDFTLKMSQPMGQEELHGYNGLRIYRQIIIDEMKDMLKEMGVPSYYGERFSHVVEESDAGVVFEMRSGARHTASMLIGADGVHSTVRRHVCNQEAHYTGLAAITSAIPSSALHMPSELPQIHMPLTIMGKHGAFIVAPQTPDGSEVQIGTQLSHPEMDHAAWRALSADTATLVGMFRKGMESRPDFVQSGLNALTGRNTNLWPFYRLPPLDRWASPCGRVVLIGDAAHAIPPSSGQGINQAFEDAYSLGSLVLLISSGQGKSVRMDDALGFWQQWRQARVDKVLDLVDQVNKLRAPQSGASSHHEEAQTVAGGQHSLDWLFAMDIDFEMESWVRSQTGSETFA